ncbi:MAG: histidine phosphatase family protein [Treponema sp.]|uniref:histidine phosphatase family protein n=1 Tax=Treponema sp. TaxID=166 RepID=UPI0025F1E7A1|nr:histidine phosphatase family protein [Treponema sp.]MBQ8679201.1 histidine phosphatase family protein [Treponema sp.]
MKKEIFLFRHGRTLANEKKLYCGKSDLPLSPRGEAELLKKKGDGKKILPSANFHSEPGFSYPDISHCTIFTSGLMRTIQTLKTLYPELSDLAIVEKGFQEINFGDFEMKSYDELKENPDYQKWLQEEVDRIPLRSTESSGNPCPNGESWGQMNERVLVSLEKILNNERSVAIFTHGGPISAIMTHFFPDERKSLYEWQPDFGEGYKITIDEKSVFYEKIPQEGVRL